MMNSTNLSALVSGAIFSAGLLVSQMVNPEKVLNFLDFFGQWDPSLLLVMCAALSVYWIAYFMIKPKMTSPVNSSSFDLPNQQAIDLPLFTGAVLFGLGWGLTGLCPGPALANIPGGEPKLLAFVVVLLLSMKTYDWVSSLKRV